MSSLSFWSCPCLPCLPCLFGRVLVILVFSEGKTEDTIFWGKTRWFLREKQGDKRKTRFLRKKGAFSEGKPAHTLQQHAYSRQPTAAAPLQQQAPVDLYYSSRQSHATRHCCLNCCSPRPTSTSSCPSTTSRRVTQRWST